MSYVVGIRRRQLSPPITWPYKKTVAAEVEQKTEDTQSFNESTNEGIHIVADVTGSQAAGQTVYGTNYVGQDFPSHPTKFVEVSAIEVKMDKNGAPPKNCVVELRNAVEVDSVWYPGSTVYASVEITAAEIVGAGTVIKKSLSTPAYLTPNTRYAVTWRQMDNGGDAGVWYRPRSDTEDGFHTSISADGGDTWATQFNNHAYYLKIYGVLCVQIYSGTINISEILVPAAKGRLEISINSKANSGNIKLVARVDDASDDVSHSSVTAVDKICFSRNVDFTDQGASVAWTVYANGNGVAYSYSLQRCYYYNKNPVTPADFGKHALLLWSFKLGLDDVVKFDNNFNHLLPNLEIGTWPASFEGLDGDSFITKIEVIRGAPVLVFFGW